MQSTGWFSLIVTDARVLVTLGVAKKRSSPSGCVGVVFGNKLWFMRQRQWSSPV
jgi:hypothetical protein